MDYLVEHHVRPLYESTIELFEHLARDGAVPPIAPAHLYYILTGAGPTMFVLGPECERLTGLDPHSDEVITAHADRSEEHTSELQSLMRTPYAVFCLKKKK